jgi:transcription termination/antitermination protein NusG
VTALNAAVTIEPPTMMPISPHSDVADTAWFAVWTRNQYEPKVAERLRRKAVEVFLPCVAVASGRRDRRRVLSRPLFPGYLFVHLVPSRETYVQVASTEGVVRLLGEYWDRRYAIADAQVEAVRRIVASGDGARPVPWIRVGDRVRIVAGPLAGLEGFVQARRDGRATFVVSVDLLQRSVGVEVAAEFLQRD